MIDQIDQIIVTMIDHDLIVSITKRNRGSRICMEPKAKRARKKEHVVGIGSGRSGM